MDVVVMSGVIVISGVKHEMDYQDSVLALHSVSPALFAKLVTLIETTNLNALAVDGRVDREE